MLEENRAAIVDLKGFSTLDDKEGITRDGYDFGSVRRILRRGVQQIRRAIPIGIHLAAIRDAIMIHIRLERIGQRMGLGHEAEFIDIKNSVAVAVPQNGV